MREGSPRYLEVSPERARKLERIRPTDRVVITGASSMTSLGDEQQTFRALNEGRSGAVRFPNAHIAVQIAAPLPDDYRPLETLAIDLQLRRRLTEVAAMATEVVWRAGHQAGILGEDNRLVSELDRRRVAGWISSGEAGTPYLSEIGRTIREKGSDRVKPFDALNSFSEQLGGNVSSLVGYSGWGGNTVEACATGASNPVEGARLIQGGYADIVIAGGFEEVLRRHPDIGITLFGSLNALSKRNDDPEGASRPFDQDRDGFVHGAGGGVVVMESLEHALRRGAGGRILAEVDGHYKSMDGGESMTSIDVERAAGVVQQAIYDRHEHALKIPDAIFAHATSTKLGDRDEAKIFETVFGPEVGGIPIAAIKSSLGHLLGGAGAANIVEAIYALRAGVIPPIRNLENPGEDIPDLRFVREGPLYLPLERVLTTAFGFGGHSAVLMIKRYRP